jgi:hypothetical protein
VQVFNAGIAIAGEHIDIGINDFHGKTSGIKGSIM